MKNVNKEMSKMVVQWKWWQPKEIEEGHSGIWQMAPCVTSFHTKTALMYIYMCIFPNKLQAVIGWEGFEMSQISTPTPLLHDTSPNFKFLTLNNSIDLMKMITNWPLYLMCKWNITKIWTMYAYFLMIVCFGTLLSSAYSSQFGQTYSEQCRGSG